MLLKVLILRYQNGFDCQGLWVEVEVEKELGFTSKRDIEDFGIEKFVNMCKERVKKILFHSNRAIKAPWILDELGKFLFYNV